MRSEVGGGGRTWNNDEKNLGEVCRRCIGNRGNMVNLTLKWAPEGCLREKLSSWNCAFFLVNLWHYCFHSNSLVLLFPTLSTMPPILTVPHVSPAPTTDILDYYQQKLYFSLIWEQLKGKWKNGRSREGGRIL